MAKINQVLGFRGLERVLVNEAQAGDIVLINGIEDIGIGITIADPEKPEALPMLKVDEPTLTMNFQVNTSPLAGKRRQVRDQPPDSRAPEPRTDEQRRAAVE
jgi:GTP-binding protein